MSSLSIPKIQVGKSGYKQEKIALNHDCSTSTDWGFVQAVMCHKMIANSTVHLNGLRSVVRVSPLVKPTFGSASWKTYHRFVPIADLMPSYEYMLKGEPYYVSNQSANYIPTAMPWLYVMDLTRILLGLKNWFSIYIKQTTVGSYHSLLTENSTVRTAVLNAFIPHTVLSNGQESGISSSYHIATPANSVVPDSADFVMFDQVTASNITYDIMVCFRLNRKCRNIRKVLVGLGFQLDPNLKREVCVLPIFAYFRSWFELFAPKRDTGWTATTAFYLLDYFREKGITNIVNDNTVRPRFKNWIEELSLCFYTDDPDFVSSHIPNPAVGGYSLNGLKYNDPQSLTMIDRVYAPTGTQAFMNGGLSTTIPLTAVAVRMLDRLTKFANKDSQIAHRIDTWLAAHGFGKSLTDIDPYNIGSDSVPINIESVMSTADTDRAGLGDFAGTAVGYKDFNQYPDFHYTAKSPGYWITLGCCVPDSGWFQGLAPDSGVLDVRRFDEYFPEFDSLGFEISTKDQVVCNGAVSSLVVAGTDPVSFGFTPRYSRHKVIQNVVNGDLSLRSTRVDCLPYTLDRYISPTDMNVESSGEGANVTYTVTKYDNTVPIASEVYRYIGKYAWLGNYDRIFQMYSERNSWSDAVDSENDWNSNPTPDHFIVHNYFDMSYMAPMLSLKDSFDTDSFDNSIDVTKA